MLDAHIDLVLCAVNLPRLDAGALFARLRASSIRRLREIPLVLIVSDANRQEDIASAHERGMAGFITRAMKKDEILATLKNILPEHHLSGAADPIAGFPLSVEERLLESGIFRMALDEMPLGGTATGQVAALVFGIDHRDELMRRFGSGVSALLADRLAALLVGKLGAQDVIGRYCGDRLAIISKGVDLRQAVQFGKRVGRSLKARQIVIRGEKVKLTVSVGVASTEDRGVSCGRELLHLAANRLDRALRQGGDGLVSESEPSGLIEALNTADKARLRTEIRALGIKILPLLQAIEHEMGLGLPLERIEQHLQEQAAKDAVSV